MNNCFAPDSRQTTRNSNARASGGFTLIEVMIVVAILGIIMAIGLPTYNSYIEKTRRADAIALLSEVAGEQQRFFTENNRFATTMTEMGYAAATEPSENGFYAVSVSGTSPDGSTYTLTAAPVAGEAQEGDTKCGSFTINSAGAKGLQNASETVDYCW